MGAQRLPEAGRRWMNAGWLTSGVTTQYTLVNVRADPSTQGMALLELENLGHAFKHNSSGHQIRQRRPAGQDPSI
jgi:hypothetical protein